MCLDPSDGEDYLERFDSNYWFDIEKKFNSVNYRDKQYCSSLSTLSNNLESDSLLQLTTEQSQIVDYVKDLLQGLIMLILIIMISNHILFGDGLGWIPYLYKLVMQQQTRANLVPIESPRLVDISLDYGPSRRDQIK
jgi:hypothetical protein